MPSSSSQEPHQAVPMAPVPATKVPVPLANGGIRGASYSGVRVYEFTCRGYPVMRRMADGYINATQILRAAGLPKPQRTKILERDVTGGVHEKVQGGYAGFQGTWIPLDSARLLARAHGIEADLDPLLSYQPKPGDSELPKKFKKRKTVVKTEKPDSTQKEQHKEESATPKWTSSSTFESSSSEAEGDATGEATQSVEGIQSQETAEAESPEGRRTTTMSLRPAGTRKRRAVYPGEDEEDDEMASPKKRRLESPFSRSSSPMVNSTHTRSGSTFPQPRAPGYNRDKTPPHAGKRCEGCGVTSTPQWRRGPSGKRTLCNACGVKWSFGRLNTTKDSSKSHTDDQTSDSEMSMDVDVDGPAEAPQTSRASTARTPANKQSKSTAALELQIKNLKRQLRESERSRKRLRKILEEAVTDDSTIDHSYRAVLNNISVRPASGSSYSPPTYAPAVITDDEDSASSDEEDSGLTEQAVVSRFLKAVRDNRSKMQYHLGRMRVGEIIRV